MSPGENGSGTAREHGEQKGHRPCLRRKADFCWSDGEAKLLAQEGPHLSCGMWAASEAGEAEAGDRPTLSPHLAERSTPKAPLGACPKRSLSTNIPLRGPEAMPFQIAIGLIKDRRP